MESFVLKVSIVMALASSSAANFYQDVSITWGGQQRAWIDNGGQVLHLSLDKQSGSGFKSKKKYLYSWFDMQLKLIYGNSAGTVTSFYLSSEGVISSHDEIDFEFLGNSAGQPYTLSTNIFVNGAGNREQQFHLWFDPTIDYHTYTILWNSTRIIQMVDNIPIRVFNNDYAAHGVPFPTSRKMSMIGSLWNASWATQGGNVQIDWKNAPFKATYQNLKIVDCTKSTSSSCKGELSAHGMRQLRWVQRHYMTYNYCNDKKRYPKGLPKECTY